MNKNFIYILFFLITFSGLAFSSEYTDQLLDESMVEFSDKNYEKSLEIIEEVLALEPENSTALLYKSTIEDVIKIDEEEALNSSSLNENESEVKAIDEPIQTDDNTLLSEFDHDLFDVSTNIFNTTNNFLTISHKIDLIFGKPVIDFQIISDVIDYNILNINIETFPLDILLSLENYRYDFSAGYRVYANDWSSKNSGFFDIKIGASDFTIDSESNVVPYIGFDTRIYPFKPYSDNYLLENLWVGGSGALYSLNNETLNNFKIETSTGLNFGNFYIGGIYSYTNLNSEKFKRYNIIKNGIVLGFQL